MTLFNRPVSRVLMAAITCAAVTATQVQADETALYDEAAPSDAVFVRLLAEYDAPGMQVPFGSMTLPLGDAARDTYVAISAAQLSDVIPGSYYSVTSGPSGPQMIAEPQRETAAKVHLILLNTGSSAVRLIVPGPDAEVVGPQSMGEAASRAVNPVSTMLAVERLSDKTILGSFDVTLARGQNLTFVAGDDTARLVENGFGPVLTLN